MHCHVCDLEKVSNFEIILILVILYLFIFDQITTTIALANGGVEYNLIFAQFKNDLIFFNIICIFAKLLAVLIIVFILPRIYTFMFYPDVISESKFRSLSLCFFCSWFCFVIYFNLFIGKCLVF